MCGTWPVFTKCGLGFNIAPIANITHGADISAEVTAVAVGPAS